MKTKYCFNIAGNSYRSLLVLFLLFNSHFYKLISQPVLKSGVSFQSSLGHGDSEDWPQCMIQSSDCLHYYFAGFTQYHDAVNGCYGPPNEPQDQVRAPIIGKFNPVTGTLIWERE
ncbi:MAG: hypothetical protein IPG95_00130 [Saprospiraceae bacterium]|nr:hypothetical protein [Saprospiraceae bacterium]